MKSKIIELVNDKDRQKLVDYLSKEYTHLSVMGSIHLLGELSEKNGFEEKIKTLTCGMLATVATVLRKELKKK